MRESFSTLVRVTHTGQSSPIGRFHVTHFQFKILPDAMLMNFRPMSFYARRQCFPAQLSFSFCVTIDCICRSNQQHKGASTGTSFFIHTGIHSNSRRARDWKVGSFGSHKGPAARVTRKENNLEWAWICAAQICPQTYRKFLRNKNRALRLG